MSAGWINLDLHTQCGKWNTWPTISAYRSDNVIMADRWKRNQITLA
jgi:hypothetical protein